MIDVNNLTAIPADCSLTEFVGTTVLDTIGLVIPGIDASLLGKMELKKTLQKPWSDQFPHRSRGTDQRRGRSGQINEHRGRIH